MFLALGLVLGLAGGAALIEVMRGRPAAPREVRVTISSDIIPRRRSATLADHAFATAIPEPARGGPADRRDPGHPDILRGPDRRTVVRSGPVGVMMASSRAMAVPIRPETDADPRWGIPVEGQADPRLAAPRVLAVSSAMRSGDHHVHAEPAARHAATAVAVLERPASMPAPDPVSATAGDEPTRDGDSGGGRSLLSAADQTDACAAERRIAAERCGLAVRSRASAEQAADAVRVAQRTYDEHLRRADVAEAAADSMAVRRAKEAAQARFRATYDRSHSTDEAEAAARDWLIEINEINAAARTAGATAKRERGSAASIGASLERMGLGADAARIAAESAEAACLAARQAVAECEERGAGITPPVSAPRTPSDHEPIGDDEPLVAAFSSGDTPNVFRLVRGERSALVSLVERLAGTDAAARRKWQLTLSSLVDAIVAVSIEAGALEFPSDHPFWSAFTHEQDREIAQALASLGHRFDGLGGFADDRFPTQRDLSLAMGYAGLDPMRIRQWPTEAEMAALYRDVTVAADEHLSQTAGDLTLGELVALLGRRADGLAELWNEWGRVRPLLLEGA
jgi:hypothetical protein